jgi:hypothetical protein
MISPLPLGYLTQPEYALKDSTNPPIDAVDFATFFKNENPYNLRITTALRMNATFPFILPVVKLPCKPYMNIMDAGLRDNFGIEVATRYLYTMRNWINENAGDVIYLEIRDTREHEVFKSTNMQSLGEMLSSPLFVIQDKWEPFQSYNNSNTKDFLPSNFNNKVHVITMQYIPEEREKAAALNFHLTGKEKMDIQKSIRNAENARKADTLIRLLNKSR